MKLSPRQDAAVNAPAGGIFVSAAAGSGKTRVLTERFARLVTQRVAEGDCDALQSVVAVTFTEKAAGEVSERIRGAFARTGTDADLELARNVDEAWIGTIHGLCSRILRRHAFEAGIDPMFSVADEVESGIIRREAFELAVEECATEAGIASLLDLYDLERLEESARAIDEQMRSLDLGFGDLKVEQVRLAPAYVSALSELERSLAEMRGFEGRKITEEKNIAALAGLTERLSAVEPSEEEAAYRILEALNGFKQGKGCRECAKPLALHAEETAQALRQAAVDAFAAAHAEAFLQLLTRYAAHYARLKDERGTLDFEDLQIKTRELLESHPRRAAAYRSRFAEVMVDEFQDTNALQVSVVEALAGPRVASVGDEKQSIYGWRNADVEVFRERQAKVADDRRFELPENYRSHSDLVRFFNGLFTAAPFWPGDFMELEAPRVSPPDCSSAWPEQRPRVSVTLIGKDACAEDGPVATEARAVADHFVVLRDEGVRQGEIVLLLRAMTHAERFEEALRAAGFDVFVGSGGTYFDTVEAEELQALLRCVANSSDDEAFARLLVGRMAGLSDDALLSLRRTAGRTRSLWEAAIDPARDTLASSDEEALRQVVAALERARTRQGSAPLYDLVHDACEDLDYDLALFAAGKSRAWANALKFARLAGEFDQASGGDPSAFLEYLETRRMHKRYEQQAATAVEGVDAVRIMTVHGAKGLEFPVVAVAGLGSPSTRDQSPFRVGRLKDSLVLGSRLPVVEAFGKEARDTSTFRALGDASAARELDESKRVFYVACTRASEALALFGVTDLEADPDPDKPMGWVRAVTSGAASTQRSGTSGDEAARQAIIGGVGVQVRVISAPAEPLCADDGAAGGSSAPGGPAHDVRDWPVGSPDGAVGAVAEPAHGTSAPRRISYTGLNTFRTCPRRYHATYLAKIGQRIGDEPAEALRVGSAVHAALRLCRPDARLSEERLAAISRYEGLGPESVERVVRAVNAFLGSDVAVRAHAAPSVLHEVPFGVLLGETVLDGNIDLLARDGEGALVVDYKTGSHEPDADAIEHWRLQSACYALAVLASGAEAVEVVFVRVEAGGAQTRFSYTAGQAGALREEIEATIGEIAACAEAGMFAALASYSHDACAECPARGVLCDR